MDPLFTAHLEKPAGVPICGTQAHYMFPADSVKRFLEAIHPCDDCKDLILVQEILES